MRTMERDDVEPGPEGRPRSRLLWRIGLLWWQGHRGHAEDEDAVSRQRTSLEERQRNLEQELAEVTGKLRELRADRS